MGAAELTLGWSHRGWGPRALHEGVVACTWVQPACTGGGVALHEDGHSSHHGARGAGLLALGCTTTRTQRARGRPELT